ncbi:MAG: phosphoribosyl-AMP cyclohydrolase [Micavibrio aeruginosavorus]|uniref:Phosphoribosyl-AMP cyclohydrolase n=1 Tax=Micavibrio aeruginosavorus TaxID=349221 RepID=A0A2W5PWG7_9BACT|nr:MAG: phosphoribosyl-AMP cyclohydrolase [Micavibrio aeruginosavorus]
MTSATDETKVLSPNYNKDGLIAAIAQDLLTREILMLAWMNEEALQKTLQTGEAHYWSRSRGQLWHKGATSGSIQRVKEIRIDCDQDAVVLLVEQTGEGACHTGRPSCFYRKIDKANEEQPTALIFLDAQPK